VVQGNAHITALFRDEGVLVLLGVLLRVLLGVLLGALLGALLGVLLGALLGVLLGACCSGHGQGSSLYMHDVYYVHGLELNKGYIGMLRAAFESKSAS